MKRGIIITVAALLVIVAVVGGYLIGFGRGQAWGLERLQLETQGNLSWRLEALSRMRTGDQAGSIAITEQNVDAAIVSLPMGMAFDDLPEPTQRVLMAAKVYRTAFPSDLPEVGRVLEGIPPLPLDHVYCSEALRQVAELADDDRLQLTGDGRE